MTYAPWTHACIQDTYDEEVRIGHQTDLFLTTHCRLQNKMSNYWIFFFGKQKLDNQCYSKMIVPLGRIEIVSFFVDVGFQYSRFTYSSRYLASKVLADGMRRQLQASSWGLPLLPFSNNNDAARDEDSSHPPTLFATNMNTRILQF